MKFRLVLALLVAGAALAQAQQVTADTLADAQDDNESWLMYGRNYSAWRYSPLDEINTANVQRILPAWIFQTGTVGKVQTTPLVHDGVMYVTGPSNHAWALDLKTGRELWHYSEPVPPDLAVCLSLIHI